VDPVGSILALPESLNGRIHSYKVEGIGYDFIPIVLDRSVVDEWMKTVDEESFLMARRLIREEGLLVGGSSGSAMIAALKAARSLNENQRVVVILADSVRNYMTKFLNDKWMVDNGFIKEDMKQEKTEWWSSKPVSDLKLEAPLTVSPDVTCNQCIDIMKTNAYDQLPVVGEDGEVLGMVTMGNLTSHIVQNRVKPADLIAKVLYRQFKQIEPKTPLRILSKIFDNDHFALVVTTQRVYSGNKKASPDSPSSTAPTPSPTDIVQNFTEKKLVFGVVTRIDLLNYIISNQPIQ